MVVDLDKEKGEKVHDRTLQSGRTCASGHKLKGGEITRSDTQEERQVIADVSLAYAHRE